MIPEKFPWYDSYWLAIYLHTKDFVEKNYPQKAEEFVRAFDVFRTPTDFEVKNLPQLFDKPTLQKIREEVRNLNVAELQKHELQGFGRYLKHDHPYFCELQNSIADLVGDAVGQPVQPCYNFLSLYKGTGVCGVHMDAPFAKWTVDFCIEQSVEWPIWFSKIVSWPEEWEDDGGDWQAAIKNDPANQFQPHTMQEGEAIIFSGSSQWHYREQIEQADQNNFCHLLFFHFIPKGTAALCAPIQWPKLFGIPDLPVSPQT